MVDNDVVALRKYCLELAYNTDILSCQEIVANAQIYETYLLHEQAIQKSTTEKPKLNLAEKTKMAYELELEGITRDKIAERLGLKRSSVGDYISMRRKQLGIVYNNPKNQHLYKAREAMRLKRISAKETQNVV